MNTLSNSFILVHYQLNKEYIAQNLCENKNKPMMHCNGKCHLRKQLSEQDKKDKSPFSQTIKDKFQIQYFIESNLPSYSINILPAEPDLSYSFIIPTSAPESIFHPPQLFI